MKALCWRGKHNVAVETVKDPSILNAKDVILKITSTAICGSDLHLYDGYIPSMMPGDILGHEFMGEIVETGHDVMNLKKGDRVVVPFNIACGSCFFCSKKFYSACDNTNTKPAIQEFAYGSAGSALFGYSHMLGGFAGGQAEFVRVPFAETNTLKVPSHLPDEKVLFLSDIFPTGYMAAENANIEPGDTVAVWGCGPVGLFCIKSAFLLGAKRVIGIDDYPGRLKRARDLCGAETIDFSKVDQLQALAEMTHGRGPDSCIDAVGLEAHGGTLPDIIDRVKTFAYLGTDRPNALRMAIMACRKAGTVSIPGVYGGLLDKLPMGAAFGKGLTFKMGQTHTQRYMKPLLERIEKGEIDPSFLITHRYPLAEAATAYKRFHEEKDEVQKVVLKP